MDSTKRKEAYLLGLLTEIKREIITGDVIRRPGTGFDYMQVERFRDKTKDKVLTVLCILMGGDIPNKGAYHIRDYSNLWTWLEDNDMTIE